MSDIEAESVELNTDLKETIKEIENDITNSPLDKSIEKPKKPRSEAQKNALRKAQEARRINALKKKELNEDYMEDSEYFKKLTPKQRKLLKDMAIDREEVKTVKSKPRVKAVYESDPSSDEEVVIIKKKKPRKKKQKIIYQSASESSEEDEPIVKEIQRKKKKVEVVSSSDEEQSYEYQYQQPLTYSGVARFL
tara:strand:+ start:434 stop:1012 length:579 start_codon:yes stop_codon:yes gene_type:complete